MILRVTLPSSLVGWFKILSPLVVTALLLMLFIDVQLNLEIYTKGWIKKEIKHTDRLVGCFDPSRVSPLYNLSLARGPKYSEIHAGTPMRFEMDCYNFAGTVPREPQHFISRSIYHSYWRADLLPFEERQAWFLKSFFATQNLEKSTLILWSNGDLTQNPILQNYLRRYPQSFELRRMDLNELAKGTALEGAHVLELSLNDKKAWVDGDLVRLLVVFHYGGVWVDMDTLLTRDLAPLLEHEFVMQWDCYDKQYMPFNGALLHFHQHSPYLCEAFHIMATDRPPNPNSIDWGSLLYHKLWRRCLNSGIEPFKIMPWCFSDASNCRYDNQIPDPLKPDATYWGAGRTFEEGGPLDDVVNKVFSIHMHNRWNRNFPVGGWVDRLLLRKYTQRLGD